MRIKTLTGELVTNGPIVLLKQPHLNVQVDFRWCVVENTTMDHEITEDEYNRISDALESQELQRYVPYVKSGGCVMLDNDGRVTAVFEQNNSGDPE